MDKHERCYVFYATENYFEIVKTSILSIREYSNLPIFVYTLNSYTNFNIENVFTIKWFCDIEFDNDMYEVISNNNFYINRRNKNIYNVLIQRPLIVKDCLEKYSKTVCYIDSDSIATPYIENIFNFFDDNSNYPYFVKGLYEYLMFYGRGGLPKNAEQTNTLEHPLCELLGINQNNRRLYRQTGYFVSNEKCINFLDEWYQTCLHPEILKNPEFYAPYHEETVVNVLLWKHNYQNYLPYLYVNGSTDRVLDVYQKTKFNGKENLVSELYKIPKNKETLLFFHGEKRTDEMKKMITEIKNNSKMKILYLAPHLSTGGMPSFLLKRIKEIKNYYNNVELYVAEYEFYGSLYVVQRNQIIDLIGKDNFFELSDKNKLIDILKSKNIDIVHIDENFESLNGVGSTNLPQELYSNDRTWRVIETSHNIWFNANSDKTLIPEGYIFCSPWHEKNNFDKIETEKTTIQFPLENKKPTLEDKNKMKRFLGFDENKIHVLNVGLWTKNKNQKECLDVANIIKLIDDRFQFHFIGNQAGNFEDYWKPLMYDLPDNVTIWGERDDVDNFMIASDILMFNTLLECNPLVLRESISHNLKMITRDLPYYNGSYDNYINKIDSNDPRVIAQTLLNVEKNNNKYNHDFDENFDFAKNHIDFYKKITSSPIKINKYEIKIITHFVDGPFIEILGNSPYDYNIKVYDNNDECVYNTTIKSNHWVKMNRKYFTLWRIEVYENNNLIYNEKLNLENKKVYVSFESASLGDTLSWIPYLDEFKKTYNCDLIVSTYLNDLFINQYPNINFIKPGTQVDNLYALYRIGWFYNEDNNYDSHRHPYDPKSQPLQKTASDILGLEYKEIKPKLKYPKLPKRKKVGIAIHSTAQSKYWNNPNGWQEVVNYLKIKGYEVILYSKEDDNHMGNPTPYGVKKFKTSTLNALINDMSTCEFFIGLGSGLTWLAWSINLPVVLISGFSEKWAETKSDTYRVINEDVCHGCFNKCKLDAADWNWCPILKDTDRMFECTKTITSKMVIEEINKII